MLWQGKLKHTKIAYWRDLIEWTYTNSTYHCTNQRMSQVGHGLLTYKQFGTTVEHSPLHFYMFHGIISWKIKRSFYRISEKVIV